MLYSKRLMFASFTLAVAATATFGLSACENRNRAAREDTLSSSQQQPGTLASPSSGAGAYDQSQQPGQPGVVASPSAGAGMNSYGTGSSNQNSGSSGSTGSGMGSSSGGSSSGSR